MSLFEADEEELIPISKACQYIPNRPHISTVWRWIQRGVDGEKLETIKIGGRRYTTLKAINKFISVDGKKLKKKVNPVPKVSKAILAENELDHFGV